MILRKEWKVKTSMFQAKWIKCDVQNPNDGQEVLLTFENGDGVHVGEAIFQQGKYYYIAETNEGYFEEAYNNPIAWMPKPEPYI